MTTAAVILAAGLSTRMGTQNKLLLGIGGEPILCGVVRAVLGVTDTVPVVVLGHEADIVKSVVSDLPVDFVVNREPARGQASSVHLGLESVAKADRTLVVLGDQPCLTVRALENLLAEHDAQGGRAITVPMRGVLRGNPIVLPSALREEILASGTNIGCGSFTRRHPELTCAYPTMDSAYFLDVDTPEDLTYVRGLTNWAIAS